MREIKFRAWNTSVRKMINPDMIDCGGNCYDWDAKYSSLENEYDYILMQYTGLKDKNGVEIYEGDIIQDEDSISIIDMSNPYWCGNLLTNISQCEVIGNIYESKDLLQ